ncbi:hypothetical protein CMI41_03980 [Candidatus Pacearchaeota archaeon]|nr:hypothetical protein [Candidatus Pacearchaeota archaeon]|tara:strand:- start:2709 stop:3110 length:402 start_codon:yes stop_codon:yes gene_type:complete
MKILFICKYNRFRSKIAEALFNKLNKNPKFSSRSRGIIKGRPVSDILHQIAKKMNFEIKTRPKGISTLDLIWQDIIVIVANDVPKKIFSGQKKYGKKLIIWKIADAMDNSKKEQKRIAELIEKKVKSLIKEFS